MTEPQTLLLHDTEYETTFTRKFQQRRPYRPANPDVLLAVIPGVIQELFVQPGDTVALGQSVLILEAMKMQNHIAAPRDGRVATLLVTPGQRVAKGQPLVAFGPLGA